VACLFLSLSPLQVEVLSFLKLERLTTGIKHQASIFSPIEPDLESDSAA